MHGSPDPSPILPFKGRPTPMPKTKIALEARGLTLRSGSRIVLDSLDLSVATGEIVALVGPPSTGKSLLLRCLAGVHAPTSGSILWHGEPVGRRPGSRRLLGFVGQSLDLQPELSVTENLQTAGRRQGVADSATRAAEILELGQLGRWSNQLAGRLSKAMQHRVAIARTLVHDPPILVLDEPVGGFDVHSQRWLSELIRAIRPKTVCCTGIGVAYLWQLADRVLGLNAGRLTRLDIPTTPTADNSPRALPRSA